MLVAHLGTKVSEQRDFSEIHLILCNLSNCNHHSINTLCPPVILHPGVNQTPSLELGTHKKLGTLSFITILNFNLC